MDNATSPASIAPPRLEFNYEFLIFLILCGLLTIFFLLYFNRLFSSIVSYAIRTWTWHRYRVYIDIQALQISLLGGRIFFTGLRYHGSNETFLVQYGDITWRYWLRRVRDAEVVVDRIKQENKHDDDDAIAKNASLPCRINVNLVGMEWFVYNRSPAYESVLAGLKGGSPGTSTATEIAAHAKEAAARLRKTPQGSNEKTDDNDASGPQRHLHGRELSGLEDETKIGNDLPALLDFFPIHVECQKPAVVVGNENTKGILIVKSETISADIDASTAKTCDPYRQLFNLTLKHPVVEIRDNEDYREDQATRASKEREPVVPKSALPRRTLFRHHRRQVLHSLRNMVPYWRRSVESFSTDSRGELGTSASHHVGTTQWQGLSRYLEDRDQDDKVRWAAVEYGAENIILDSPSAQFTMYWDSVSKVSRRNQECDQSPPDSLQHINGSDAPGWGMHFVIHGGVVNYGPWADRHRADLQKVFVPNLCKDATPAQPLQEGEWRVATQFKVFIELVDTITMRIPIKEESKNWRWRGKEPAVNQHAVKTKKRQRNKKRGKTDASQTRPAGWLELKVPANATIDYSMDMLARTNGYRNTLLVDLPNSELWSSVNHDVLWRSGPQKISCNLSNPLTWNTLRDWHFDVASDNMKLYLLRDHIFLLTDLVNDWASGPPSDYMTFTPYNYHLNLNLQHIELFLNVNDGNIIDNATSLEENSFLIISSPRLAVKTTIALDKFRPEKSSIPFDIRSDTLEVSLNPSQSNTEAAFLSTREIGYVEALAVNGSYHYNATTSPANTDTLILNLHGQSPCAYVYGFLLRYALLLKDNYFGDHVHFRTLDEYQEQLQALSPGKDVTMTSRPPPKKSNDLDIMLSVKVEDAQLLVPTSLYSTRHVLAGELASLSVDVRFTNYYMDLELDLSPLSLSHGTVSGSLTSPDISTTSTQLYIDGIRVFGHRAFGLPPSEPTYLCNWDVSVGDVRGDCDGDFLSALTKGAASFIFTFDDVENALVPYSSLIFYDITFIRVNVASVCIWIKATEGAFLLSTDSISVIANDWARSHYSKKANINVPNLQLACVDLETANKHTLREKKPVKTEAFFRTDIRLASVGRKAGFTAERKLQQELVRREDQRTDRTPFLLLDGVMDEFVPESTDLPAQCAPPQPFPISFDDDDDSNSYFAAAPSDQLRSKSSFLSLSSATDASIRRTRSYASRQSGLDFNAGALPPRQAAFASSHSTVAFSSPYFPPHFNLENVSPEVPADRLFNKPATSIPEPSTSLDAIDPNGIDEDYIYSSTMVEFPSGVTAIFTPQTIKHAVSLLESIQPDHPEDILDSIQTNTLSEIFGAKKHLSSRGTIKDVLLRLPKADVRFINSTRDSRDENNVAVDRYDLTISSVDLVARTKTDSRENGVQLPLEKSHTSLQLRVDYIEASAGQYTMDEKMRQTALMARINNVLVSRGVKDVTYLDIDIGSVFGSTASGDIEYLATLIHRSASVASELGTLLSETIELQSNRVKYCCCRLLEVGSHTNDPSFLIRPSAVLRSVDQHLRTVDSWKLMMRLRQIWTLLDKKERAQFIRRCASKYPPLPQNANRFAVDAFKKWRSWDLADIEHASLLTKIFGNEGHGAATAMPDDQPLLAACRLGRFQLTLDPGPRENKIALLELNARLETKDDGLIPGLFGGQHTNKPLTVANISLQDIAINLNWELYELLEIVLRLSQGSETIKSSLKKTGPRKKAAEVIAEPESGYSASHIFLDITKVSVDLEAINLRARTMLDGFKVSAILSKDVDKSAFNSILVNCGGVTSRLHSRAQLLWMLQLRQPSISAIQQLQEGTGETVHTIKASASTKQLSVSVKQDATTLIEVVESIIKDEVAQLYRLKEHKALQQRDLSAPITSSKPAPKIKLNIMMMLGRYIISVPLLQSLTYKISGVVARAGCVADIGNEIIFDFDLKENIHEMQINVNDSPRSICIVDIPPTNGRITSHMRDDQHVLTVLSSVEVVKLDASSLYSLLAALNRPQVSDEIKEIQNQVKAIQEHISELSGPETQVTKKPTTSKAPTTSVLYDIHFTLAGLHTLAKTSSIQTGSGEYAQLLFSLGTLHIQASNKTTTPGVVLKYPEVHLDLRYIGFDVRRCIGSSTRSCGSLGARVSVYAGSHRGDDGKEKWTFNFLTDDLDINLSPQTVSTFVEVVGYLGAKIKHLDTSRELDYLKKLGQSKPRISVTSEDNMAEEEDDDILDSVLASVTYRFQLRDIKACWNVADEHTKDTSTEDLALSIKLIEFGTRTNKSARLTIDSLQLQMVEPGEDRGARSLHSALLPELTFNVAYLSTSNARRLAFQAVGKSLDLRLTPKFIVPAAYLIESISLSAKNVQAASSKWTVYGTTVKQSVTEEPPKPSQPLLGKKRLESLLIDADFAGAVVTIMGKHQSNDVKAASTKSALPGKYGQFDTADASKNATLRSPGLAWKAEYRDNGRDDPSLQGEILVDASSNILYPAVVPLVLDIVSSVKEVVSKTNKDKDEPASEDAANSKTDKPAEEENILNVDPEAVIGKLKLNLGLRIARQEFSLSCQPIARVAATTSFESVYFTLNTIASQEQGNFLAISGILNKPRASVQHVYSRDSTASFTLDTVTLSFMNSKHVSGISGVSAILNVSPMKISANARQAQDFLLFREIWYPEELRYQDMAPVAKMQTETSQGHLVQRYQQVAATAAFPWTATISIAALDVNVDLGQAIGKASFQIQNFWVSSKKTSDWEQNLCLGFDKIGIDCTGRLSGFIALQRFQMRTSIQWPKRQQALNETPLVQASLVFNALQVKAAFDYQAFLVADIRKLEFLMYNVRESGDGSGDRLVAIFNGDAVQIFGTTTSAAQLVSVYQAVQKLMQENRENFESSLKEIEKFMSRKSIAGRVTPQPRRGIPKLPEDDTLAKSPISLDTDVVVTLKALNLGVFPSTFSDHQVFKMEALNAYARFAASVEDRRVHTLLRMTLGQLRIGLAGVRNAEAPRTLSEMRVEDVVERSTGARGGTILKVPRVEAVMETWQAPKTNQIEYKFKSAFEGKVEVGWNYSRVSYIRGMWANHNKMLEQTWGKQLPMTAVKITGVPKTEDDASGGEQGKITAEVNVPQSKYNYTALEAPIIETPQLRDMGEATPPLEWIGLNRDRLPNLTHQIVIVSLLELAGEVEEAYSRILGSS